MKLMILGAIALAAAFFVLARKLQVLNKDGLRVYLVLMVAGVLVALSYGPPRYVLLERSLGDYMLDGEVVEGYQGWELNRLLPLESMATQVLYLPETDSSVALQQAGLAALPAFPGVSGGILSRYLWSILVGLFFVSVFVVRMVSRYLHARDSLQVVRQKGTVSAYQEFINNHDQGWMRPHFALRAARKEKHAVYDRYIRRLVVLDGVNERNVAELQMQLATDQHDSDTLKDLKARLAGRESYSALLRVLVSALEHGRDVKAFELPYRFERLPGIYLKGFKELYSDPKSLFEAESRQIAGNWQRLAGKFQLPALGVLERELSGEIAAFREALNQQARDALMTSLENWIKTHLQPEIAADPNQVLLLKTVAFGYIFHEAAMKLPLSGGHPSYERKYEKAVHRFILEALSRFIPDERDDSNKLSVFQAFAPASSQNKIELSLAYAGYIYSGGFVPCSARFRFMEGGSVNVERFGYLGATADARVLNEAALFDALSVTTSAFKAPAAPKPARGPELPSGDDVSRIRKVLRELDDLVSEYAKEMTKEELKALVYEQLPEEVEFAAETMLFIVDFQMNSMAENGVEVATSLLEWLLTEGDDE